MKKIINKILTLTTLLLISISDAYAGCPPPEQHWAALQCIPTKVATIAGSNAQMKLLEIQQNMITTSANLQLGLTQAMTDSMTVMQQNTNKLISSTFTVSKEILEHETTIRRSQKDMEMAYKLEIEATKVKMKRAFMSPDDSPEETEIILNALREDTDENGVLHVSGVLKLEWDDQVATKRLPIALETGRGICTEEDIDGGECTKSVAIEPGKKLERYFHACNTEKKLAEGMKNAEAAHDAMTQQLAKKLNETLSSTDSSTAIAAQIEDQNERNCTIEKKKNGLCGDSIPLEEMQVLYATCVINENGNLSASNLLSPSKVCGPAISSMDKTTYDALVHDALDNTALEEEPDQDQSAAPVVYSYNNTNQLRSALDYADNLVAMNLISNQSPKDRMKNDSLEYQSRYRSRIARLSLAQQVLLDSVGSRTGSFLSRQKIEDPNYESADPLAPVKESVLGGGELDVLFKNVEDAFEKVNFSGDGSNKDAIHGQGVEGYWDKEILIQIISQNKLLYKQILQKEKEAMLKAAQLASEVSSPNNVLYMKKLRKGE
jgi:hypothetical protein